MEFNEVETIFKKRKWNIINNVTPVKNPIAILLGGQGAVGKGNLNIYAKKVFRTSNFLEINGDLYREYHPEFDKLIRTRTFSQETQIFSKVFTEKLIETAIEKSFNIIIEGTMKNPQTILNTIDKLDKAGYKIYAYVIAAPQELSSLNSYIRYAKEVSIKGSGRLIDMQSHDEACQNLPKTIDILYKKKCVRKILVFDLFAESLIKEYTLTEKGYDHDVKPSVLIGLIRKRTLQDKSITEQIISKAAQLDLPGDLRSNIDGIIQKIQIRQNEQNIKTEKPSFIQKIFSKKP